MFEGQRKSMFGRTADALKRMSLNPGGIAEGGSAMFSSGTFIMEEARKAILDGHDETFYYHDTGITQKLARSDLFTKATLVVISVNTLWIGIELDTNKDDNLFEAAWYFQVIEISFFTFFMMEWCTRFLAFKSKRYCLLDRWFCFDSVLVSIMIVDTILLPLVLNPDQGEEEGAGMSHLSLLRMGRLLRLTRMVRFMRSVPELVSLVKSLRIAARPVFWTMVLIVFLLYMFAIIFRSQYVPQDAYLKERFSGIVAIMWALLLQGAFLDSVGKVGDKMLDENIPIALVFMAFVLVAAVTLLNLLVGVLVNVMATMAKTETEKASIAYIKRKLLSVLEDLDEDKSGTISREEFDDLMSVPTAVQVLHELGVDPTYLLSLSETIFNPLAMGSALVSTAGKGGTPALQKNIGRESDALIAHNLKMREADDSGTSSWEEEEDDEDETTYVEQEEDEDFEEEDPSMTFSDFINTVIRLRSKNMASVVDIVTVRKLIMRLQTETAEKLEALAAANAKLQRGVQSIHNHPFMRLIGAHPDMQVLGSVRRGRTSEAILPRGSATGLLTRQPRVLMNSILRFNTSLRCSERSEDGVHQAEEAEEWPPDEVDRPAWTPKVSTVAGLVMSRLACCESDQEEFEVVPTHAVMGEGVATDDPLEIPEALAALPPGAPPA